MYNSLGISVRLFTHYITTHITYHTIVMDIMVDNNFVDSLTDEDTVVLFISSACGNVERYVRNVHNLKCTVLKMDVMNGFKNANKWSNSIY